MYAKMTQITFRPGYEVEALKYIRTRMFPSASVQRGFQDAFIFQNAADPHQYTLISLWKSLETLQASHPPEDILAEQQHFETLITEVSQDIHKQLFQFSKRDQTSYP
jgi:heme-degrading monooxygenase HmoA